jgi:dienelactone hydrolase
METFVVAPGGSPRPCVVIAMNAPGVRDELRGIARDLASRGFCAALPDLYHRQGRLRFRPPLTGADRRRIELSGPAPVRRMGVGPVARSAGRTDRSLMRDC